MSAQPYFLVTPDQLREMVREETEPLRRKLEFIESCQTEWVDTKEAMRITGIKSPDTLKAERERPQTQIVAKFEGRKPLYSRASLLAYNEKHRTKPYQPKRAHHFE